MNPTLLNFFAVAIGGVVGACARYGINLATTTSGTNGALAGPNAWLGPGASLGTTIANLAGCLILGGLYQWSESVAAETSTLIGPRSLLAIRVGILGSLTTFSTLIGEATVLGGQGRPGTSLMLLAVNLIGGCILFLLAAASVRQVIG